MTPTVRRLAVARGELDVWLLPPPDSPRDVPYDELDAYERGRADSYRRPDDRQMYAAAHVGLRRVLAGYTGIEPSRLNLAGERYNGNGERHGRPVVLGVPGGAPQFSLSHSHGLAIVVVAESRVGADVQRLPSPQTAEACLPALHPAEREELEKIPEHERTMAFGRLWTRKEAYLKGLGTGLTRGPTSTTSVRRDWPSGRRAGWWATCPCVPPTSRRWRWPGRGIGPSPFAPCPPPICTPRMRWSVLWRWNRGCGRCSGIPLSTGIWSAEEMGGLRVGLRVRVVLGWSRGSPRP